MKAEVKIMTRMSDLCKMAKDNADKIKAAQFDYDYVGLRVQEEEFTLGEMTHVSHIWDNGDDTGEELPGVCAINVNYLLTKKGDKFSAYFGKHVAIVAGYRAEYGEDPGEIIIEDPVVFEILS